jgi:hypothetical protein
MRMVKKALVIVAWLIYGIVQSGNYSHPAVLVILGFIVICPFAAALLAAMWGAEFCRRQTQ